MLEVIESCEGLDVVGGGGRLLKTLWACVWTNGG